MVFSSANYTDLSFSFGMRGGTIRLRLVVTDMAESHFLSNLLGFLVKVDGPDFAMLFSVSTMLGAMLSTVFKI